jgi:hypothetical protein
MPNQFDGRRRTAIHLSMRLLASLATVVALTGPGSTALAAQGGRQALAQQPDPTDPIEVVESFLAARNARDSIGATYFSAPILAIHGAEGDWDADEHASRQWLRQLTDAYVIDMLVKPYADGNTVLWVERLAPRGLPFRDALLTSVNVDVQVVVSDGKIVSYSAAYPALQPQLPPAATPTGTGDSATRPPGIPPAVLFTASALVLAVGAFLMLNVMRVASRPRRSTLSRRAPHACQVGSSERKRVSTNCSGV